LTHENVTQGRPRIFVTQDRVGFVWEVRQESLVPIRRSLGYFRTAEKAQFAGDQALASLCRPNH
jgi:hypothetical protein